MTVECFKSGRIEQLLSGIFLLFFLFSSLQKKNSHVYCAKIRFYCDFFHNVIISTPEQRAIKPKSNAIKTRKKKMNYFSTSIYLEIEQINTFGSAFFQHLFNQNAFSQSESPFGYKQRFPIFSNIKCISSSSPNASCTSSKCTFPSSSTTFISWNKQLI